MGVCVWFSVVSRGWERRRESLEKERDVREFREKEGKKKNLLLEKERENKRVYGEGKKKNKKK